jgi:hypothetical protein
VEYKTSEAAKRRSKINKKNATKKKYHHTMGQGGYMSGKPKCKKIEDDLIAKWIIPETLKWNDRSRDWFYGHGGKLDSERKCVYTKKHDEDPLPIDALRSASKDVEEERFHPEREKNELTRALGNDEHPGQTRTIPGSKPWKLGFPVERKKFPNRRRQRRKEREADSMSLIEQELKRQSDLLNWMSLQGTAASQQQIEAAHDATGPPSQRKSSMASTDLPEDDDELAIRYLVDDITESTSCELHVKVMNITMKVVIGYGLPIGPNSTYHCRLIPHGYAVAGGDEIMGGFEKLKLDHPACEGDLYELGEAKKTTVIWLKEYIMLPNCMPRSLACHPSPPPCQPSPPSPRQPSPTSPLHQPYRVLDIRVSRSTCSWAPSMAQLQPRGGTTTEAQRRRPS